MTLSRRFAPVLIVLLLVTGAFVIRSVGDGKQFDSCRDPAALKHLERVPGTWPVVEEKDRYTTRRTQWTAGMARGGRTDPRIAIRMVRDFGIFMLWLHPRSLIQRSFVPDEAYLEWIDTEDGRVPVHFDYKYSEAQPRLVAYVYLYGGEPVANPLSAALRGSPRAVVEGSRPLTLLLVHGSIEARRLPALKSASLRWLTSAYGYYREVCGP